MRKNKIRLAVFDVEGILIETRSNLIFNKGGHFLYKLSKRRGPISLLLLLTYGLLYKINLINLRTLVTKAAKNLRGLDQNTLLEIYHSLRLRPGTTKTLKTLKQNNIKIALVSNGIPNQILKKLAEDLDADFYAGLELETKDNTITGEVLNNHYIEENKLRSIQQFCQREDISLTETATIGDDYTNLQLFQNCGMRIGINPDKKLGELSDTILYKRNLTAILPLILMGEHHHEEIREVKRKDWIRNIIHSAGILTILPALWIGEPLTILSILTITTLYLASEILRLNDLKFPLFTKITRTVARFSELPTLVATPIYFAVGIIVSYILFPRPISFAAIAIFTVGDSVANITGRKYGKIKLPYNEDKTLEGSLTGFAAALLSSSIFLPPPYALIGSALALLTESLPIPINDNLLIPLISGTSISIATLIF